MAARLLRAGPFALYPVTDRASVFTSLISDPPPRPLPLPRFTLDQPRRPNDVQCVSSLVQPVRPDALLVAAMFQAKPAKPQYGRRPSGCSDNGGSFDGASQDQDTTQQALEEGLGDGGADPGPAGSLRLVLGFKSTRIDQNRCSRPLPPPFSLPS